MDRRSFFKNSAISSLPFVTGGIHIGMLANEKFSLLLQQENDRVLVLIQQNGGNDGLNTIIPADQYASLSVLRSNILIPENRLLKLTDTTGLHPVMSGIKSLYDENALTIIQNVGYENQNRSHFRSTDIWDSGSRADVVITSGWLGRYLDTQHVGYPNGYPNNENPHPIAITMGPSVSETCQGLAANFSLAISDPTALITIPGTTGSTIEDLPYGDELSFLQQVINQTNVYAKVLQETSEKGQNLSKLYPSSGENRLADQLKTVAQLISGGLKTKIYIVNINGFDTHANQVDQSDVTKGDHAELLADLSEAILAFMDDLRLQKLDHRVIGVTRSEFGRQIASNGSLGTDHGDAAPLIVFGSCVNSGIVGENPVFVTPIEPQSGIPVQIDFKNVFGSLLVDWFGITHQDAVDLFANQLEYLPLVSACNAITGTAQISPLQLYQLRPYPNPFLESIHVSFHSPGEHIRLSLTNNLGQELFLMEDRFFTAGLHTLTHLIPNLTPGQYLYQMKTSHFKQGIPLLHF